MDRTCRLSGGISLVHNLSWREVSICRDGEEYFEVRMNQLSKISK